MLLNKEKPPPASKTLFDLPTKEFKLPCLEHNPIEDAYDELELLEFPVSILYFDLLETSFRGEILAKDLKNYAGKTVRMVGQLVTIKYVGTVKKEIMNFGTFIDYTGEFFDTVNFPNSIKYYPFRGPGVYLILGKIVEEFGFPSIEVNKMAKLPIKKDPRS